MNQKLMAILVIELILLFPIASALSLTQPVVSVNENSATINWTSSVPSDSEVQYGKTTAKDLKSEESEFVTEHSIVINNLEEFTKYYYKVVSQDENGTLASYPPSGSGQELSFITPDLTPPPKVEGLVLVNATAYTIKIEWGHVDVIDFNKYEIFRDGELVDETTQTSYTDSELLPGMPYEYKVRALDDYDNYGEFSDILSVNTIGEDKTPPEISNVRISALSETGATILWDTDENSNSKIYYGPDENLGEEESSSEMVTEHGISITGLIDGWHYYYKVESCDEKGNCAESSLNDFTAGSDFEAPEIITDIPQYYNEVGLDFNVETEPYADVRIYVNDVISRSSNSGEDGEIYFEDVILKSILPVNIVKVEAEDAAGNSAFEEYSVYLDFEKPELVIQTNVSEAIKQGSFSIQGYVNEQCTVSFYVEQEPFSFVAPEKVEGLFLEKVESGFIEFSWNRSMENDLDEYLVYREDVGLIGIEGTELFTDMTVEPGKTYTYWVSALDYDCLEGEYSDELVVKALEGVNVEVEYGDPVVPECRQKIPIVQIETSGSFNEHISLSEGNNKLIIVAEDIYGNSVNVSYDSLYDSQPPVFNSINLREISPSYNQEVKVSGNLSEPCTLEVYVNDEKVSSGETDESGLFSIDVKLDKGNPMEDSSGDVGWYNEVKVIATDRAGNTAQEVDTIEFMVCGSSNPLFAVIPKNLAPSELTPRLLYEGMGQITFELELQWLGYDDEPIVTSSVDDLELSMAQEPNYDSDIISINDIQTSRTAGEQSIAVILDINKIDPTNNEENWSIYDIEKNISKRHSGYCFTHADLMSGGLEGIEGPGCIRVPLEVELRYPVENYNGEVETVIQKECLFVDVLIQPAVDVRGSLPRELLQGMVDMLDSFIDTIDSVLEPIHTVSTYLMYGCLSMRVVHLATQASEWFSCQTILIGELLNIDSCKDCKVKSDGSVSCDESACSSCVSARLRTYSVEKAMHLLCDRTQCNSIPSFSTYAQNQEDYSFSAEESACVGYTEGESITYGTGEDTDPLAYNDETLISTFGNDPCDICAVLPEAEYCQSHIECCAVQYKEEWDSASLFTNEIKESACLSNNLVDNVLISDDVKEVACGSGISQIFRGVRDFSLCDSEQQIERFEQSVGDDAWLVMVKVKEAESDEEDDTWELVLKTRDYSDVNIIYEEGEDETEEEGEESSGETLYIYSWLKTNQGDGTQEGIDADDIEDMLEDSGDFNGFIDDIYSSTRFDTATNSVVEYTKTQCNNIVNGELTEGDSNWPKYIYPDGDLNARRYIFVNGEYQLQNPDFIVADLPKSYVNYICEGYEVSESHILDPTSGLFKAIEAMCIPAIEGYLSQTRTLMSTMKGCINQILITGEGSAGYCQQFLSVYVCDIMYYTLSCVKKMTPGSSSSTGYKGGIAGFGQYLLTSIQETQRGIENRYGSDSSMATLLSGKEIFNSACMAMFGADIDFDFDAMIDMSVEPNIEPMVDISGGTRRFTGVNADTGYVTYVYNIFPLLITEKDVSYTISLVCSDSYTCNPDYGYEDGKCDCAGIGEKSVVIDGGRLDAGDVLGDDGDEELFEEVTAKYRYDKVVLDYSYIAGEGSRVQDRGNRIEQSVESDLMAVGGLAPAYCFMRISPEPEFRCNIAADEGARARFIDPVVTEDKDVKEFDDEDERLYYGDSFISIGNIKIDVEDLELSDYGNVMPIYLVATLLNNENKEAVSPEQRQISSESVIVYDEDNDPFQYILQQDYFTEGGGVYLDKGDYTCNAVSSDPDSLESNIEIVDFDFNDRIEDSDDFYYIRYKEGSWNFHTTSQNWPILYTCEEGGLLVTCKNTEGYVNMTIRLDDDYSPEDGDNVKFKIKNNEGESTEREYVFKLKLELFNSKMVGTSIEIDESSPVIYNGIEQELTYEFRVVNGERQETEEDTSEEDTEEAEGEESAEE